MVNDALIKSPRSAFEMFAVIRDDQNRPLRPTANVLQRRFFAYWEKCYEENRPARGIICKSRKRGASTTITYAHYWAMMRHGYSSALVGHLKLSSTQVLADMADYLFRHDKYPWGVEQTKKGVELKWDNGAELLRFTDRSPEAIRSATIQLVHSTETAFYQNGKVTIDAALNAVPHTGFSSVWLESTPDGIAGTFPERFIEGARWPTKDECPDGLLWWAPFEPDLANPNLAGVDSADTFVRIFSAWFEHEEFFTERLTAEQQRQIEDSIDSQEWFLGERELIHRYGTQGPQGLRLGSEVGVATVWEQLAWRRLTLLNYCGKDKTRLDREYPAGPMDGFRSTGAMFFDRDSITELERRTSLVQPTHIVLQYREQDNSVAPIQTAADDAMFRIYEQPILGCKYLVSVDPARGIDQHLKGAASSTSTSGNPDRHGVMVLRAAYRDVEGTIHRPAVVALLKPPSFVPLHVLARWVAHLSIYYGRCIVIPEVNAHGLALVYKMEPFSVPIFSMPREDPRTGKSIQGETATGWLTTTVTRPLILDNLHQVIQDDVLDIWDVDVVSELRTTIRNLKTSKIEADSGAKDDLVLSLAIGVYNIASATMYSIAPIPQRIPEEVRRMEEMGGAKGGSANFS